MDMNDPPQSAKVCNEVQALMRLEQTPSAVRYYGVEIVPEHDGALTPYICMEYLPGPMLQQYIATLQQGRTLQVRQSLECPLSPSPFSPIVAEDEIRQVAVAVLNVLFALHNPPPGEAPMVHRDIKPSNIMRAADGRWVVIDMGEVAVCQYADASCCAPGSQHYINHMGAELYDDPSFPRPTAVNEDGVFLQPPTVVATVATDYWSLGVVLGEMALGTIFEQQVHEQLGDLMYTIRSGNIWALDRVMQQQGLSIELRDLLLRLLAVDPRQRLVGAEDIIQHPFFRC
eukprot:jgi/Chrzof1/430/Cz01g15180.t1